MTQRSLLAGLAGFQPSMGGGSVARRWASVARGGDFRHPRIWRGGCAGYGVTWRRYVFQLARELSGAGRSVERGFVGPGRHDSRGHRYLCVAARDVVYASLVTPELANTASAG